MQTATNLARKGISNWKIALIALLIGAGLYLAWYYQYEPIRGWFNPVFEPMGSAGETVKGIIPAITDYVSKNPIAVVTGAITTGSLVGGKLLDSYHKKKELELQFQAQQSQQQAYAYSIALREQQSKLADYENQLKTLQNPDLVGEAQSIISQKTAEITQLQKQIYEQSVAIRTLQEQLALEKIKVHETIQVK